MVPNFCISVRHHGRVVKRAMSGVSSSFARGTRETSKVLLAGVSSVFPRGSQGELCSNLIGTEIVLKET